jgi:hypothetical protein
VPFEPVRQKDYTFSLRLSIPDFCCSKQIASFAQRCKTQRLGGGFFPLTGAAAG